MQSKWYGHKAEAIKLRRQGRSLKNINKNLGVPLSTLSGWLKHIELTHAQKVKLENDWKKALINARKKAVVWHNSQKEMRIERAIEKANFTINNLNLNDIYILELALSMLYLGEGYKVNSLGIGSSDPQILKFFLSAIEKVYGIERSSIKCELNLRADQDSCRTVKFWSKELKISTKNFNTISFDKRTIGKPTYSSYHGVCQLRCGNVAIQRRLLFVSKLFCDKVIGEDRAVSSVGRAFD